MPACKSLRNSVQFNLPIFIRLATLVAAACNALGFSWIDEEKSSTLVSRADVDENEVIDFEEFINTTPKVLRANLVRLAKENGNDLGFLV